MKKTWFFVFIVLLVTLCISAPIFATESGHVVVVLSPDPDTVMPGEDLLITVTLAENTGFSQMVMQISYDTEAVTFQNCSETLFPFTADTSTPGLITISVEAQPEGEEGTVFSETGTLALVLFRVNEGYEGTFTISTSIQTLKDADGEDSTSFVNGGCEVICVGEAAHEHTEQVVEGYAATCSAPGLTDGVVCAVCGEILVPQEEIPVTDHIPGEPVRENEVPASCQRDESYDLVVSCIVCNAELSRDKIVNPTTGEHNYSVEQERKDPTCTEEGYVIRACECGETQTETLAAAGHKEVVDAAVEATCTATGLTEGSHCETCGEILAAQEETPVTGHTEVVLQGYAATCESTGLTDGLVCSGCGLITKAQEQTPMVDHMEELIPGKAATCTEPGLTDGTACAFCNLEMTPQEEIPALGHTEIYVSAVAPTCSATGRTAGTRCATCSIVMSGCEVVAKIAHTEMILRPVEPTCSSEGLTEGKYCMVCGYVIAEQSTIPALEHTPQTIPAVSPTCATVGWTEGSRCEMCNEVLQNPQQIPTTAHTVQIIEGYPATCSQVGMTDGKRCEMCETVLEQQVEIPRLEHQYDHGCDVDCNVCSAERLSVVHTFGEWNTLREATKDSPGEQYRLCRHCTFRESRMIPELTMSENRGLIIGVSYVIMVGCVVVILVILRRKKPETAE